MLLVKEAQTLKRAHPEALADASLRLDLTEGALGCASRPERGKPREMAPQLPRLRQATGPRPGRGGAVGGGGGDEWVRRCGEAAAAAPASTFATPRTGLSFQDSALRPTVAPPLLPSQPQGPLTPGGQDAHVILEPDTGTPGSRHHAPITQPWQRQRPPNAPAGVGVWRGLRGPGSAQADVALLAPRGGGTRPNAHGPDAQRPWPHPDMGATRVPSLGFPCPTRRAPATSAQSR